MAVQTAVRSSPLSGTAAQVSALPDRAIALDVFRGLTIAGMLLVNNIALDSATPRQLMHAGWNLPVTFTDMIFPWFLLAMGISIPFSRASWARRAGTDAVPWRRILVRAAVLVVLGWLVDTSVNHRLTLGLGVLQLIGLSYLVVAPLGRAPAWQRLGLAGTALATHWAALRFMPFPGGPAGTLEPSQNLISFINSEYLRAFHLEGVLSVIPVSGLVLIGTLLGDVLRRESPAVRQSLRLGATGGLLAAAGVIVATDLPMNKPLWTASYLLYAAGLGSVLLAGFVMLFDVLRVRWLAFPFVVLGANAIVAYVLPVVFKSFVPVARVLPPTLAAAAGAIAGGWLYTLAFIGCWWLVLLWMYRRRAFLRL